MSEKSGCRKPTDEEKIIALLLRHNKYWTEAHDEWVLDLVKRGVITEFFLDELLLGDKDEVEVWIRHLQDHHKEVLGPRFLGEKNLADLRAVLRVCWDRHKNIERQQKYIEQKRFPKEAWIPKPKTTTASTSTSSTKKQASSKQSSKTSRAHNIDASKSSATTEKPKKSKKNNKKNNNDNKNSSSSSTSHNEPKSKDASAASSKSKSKDTSAASSKSKSKDASAASSKSKSKDASATSSKPEKTSRPTTATTNKTIAGDANSAASQSGKDATGPTVSTKTNTKKKSKASKATVTSSEPGKDTTGSTTTSANTNTKFQSDRDARAAARAARGVIANDATESIASTETDTKSKKKAKANNASDVSSKSGKDSPPSDTENISPNNNNGSNAKPTTKTNTKSKIDHAYYDPDPGLFFGGWKFKKDSKANNASDASSKPGEDATGSKATTKTTTNPKTFDSWILESSYPRVKNNRKNPPSDTENISPNNNNGSNATGNNKTKRNKTGSDKTAGSSQTGTNTANDSLQVALKDMEAKLKAEVAAHNTTKQELEAKVKAEVAAHNNTKQESEAKLGDEVAAHNNTKQELEAKLKAEVEAHNKTKLEGEVAARNNTKEEPEGEVASHNKTKEEMEAKLKAEVAAHNNMKVELAACQREKSAIDGQNQQLQQQCQLLEADISNLRLPFPHYNQSHEDCILHSYNHIWTVDTQGPTNVKFRPFDYSSPVVAAGGAFTHRIVSRGQDGLPDGRPDVLLPIYLVLISSGSTNYDNVLYLRKYNPNPTTPLEPYREILLHTIQFVSTVTDNNGNVLLVIETASETLELFGDPTIYHSWPTIYHCWATTIQFILVKMGCFLRGQGLRG